MFCIRAILCPTDFSASADKAFDLACSLARDYDARLIVVHVARRPPTATTGEVEEIRTHPQGGWQEAQAKLCRYQDAVPGTSTIWRMSDDNAASVIVSVAQENGCDLIVMGTHGRSGLKRLLLGSVAESVLRHAACPVLTVTAPDKE
jgi:nucleotide-binding universal stress UspA family protein